MKPSNWTQLSPEEKQEAGEKLLMSERGQFIVSKALRLAIAKLDEVQGAMQETSDIEDMETLYETNFPMYRSNLGLGPEVSVPTRDIVG